MRCLPWIRAWSLPWKLQPPILATTDVAWRSARSPMGNIINQASKQSSKQSSNQASSQASNQAINYNKREEWKNGKMEKSTPRGMHLIENSDAVQGSLDPLLHGRCFPPSRATTQHTHASVISADICSSPCKRTPLPYFTVHPKERNPHPPVPLARPPRQSDIR